MSTESAVLNLSDHLLGSFDRDKYTVARFSDLIKAIDTLTRSILVCNLRCYGGNSRALECFVSYYSQQEQFVNMLHVSSPAILIDIGLAQGSCLSPLMFIFFI